MSPLSAVPDLDQPPEAVLDQADTVLRVRRLPAPHTEPPLEDTHAEHGVDAGEGASLRPSGDAPTQGSLALAFPEPEPVHKPDLRLVPEPAPRPASWAAPQPTPTSGLPEIQRWARRFVQATVEVVAGDRPLRQLSRWASDEVREELQRHRTASRPSTSPVASRPAGTPSVRGVVRSIHVGEPRDGVAEVSAVVQRGVRRHAVALRFEGLDGRWLCTVLQVG